MTIGEQTKKWFDDHGEDFAATLLRCFFRGWVYRLADFVLMAEEVYALPGKGVLGFGDDVPKNCWFLFYLGHSEGLYTPYDYMTYAPYPLPYVAYKRKGRIVVRSWDRLRRDYNVRVKRMDMSPLERSY